MQQGSQGLARRIASSQAFADLALDVVEAAALLLDAQRAGGAADRLLVGGRRRGGRGGTGLGSTLGGLGGEFRLGALELALGAAEAAREFRDRGGAEEEEEDDHDGDQFLGA